MICFGQENPKEYSTNLITQRILPPSVVLDSFIKDDISSPTHLQWQGKDTPLHSGDVAKSMLQIPSFSMARKGGGGSEIFFRSQGASRLPIFVSGGYLSGACSGRMDTTITYVFPENYNRISVLKGPQDVRYGSLIAGGVLFERDITRFLKPSFNTDVSALYGSFGRFDMNANVIAGGTKGSLQAIYSHYQSNDYRSGDDKKVHSAYKRESVSLIGALTPNERTNIELDVDIGRGNASYADRAMDASAFDRISYNLALQQYISDINRLDVRLWRNEIDHIMDNFSYRPPPLMYMLSNPKRVNTGGRIEARFYPNESIELYVGGSYNHDEHSSRATPMNSTTKELAQSVLSQSYTRDFTFDSAGVFTQGQYAPTSQFALAFGARYDYLKTQQETDSKESLHSLASGFMRYEHYIDETTLYAGIGVAQRGADFWEVSKTNGMNLRPETNTQFDMGLVYEGKAFHTKVSAYASHITNYILLHYVNADNTNAFNTDAFLGGGELEAEYIAWERWHFYGSLAYTYALNLRSINALESHSPLPQIAPLQAQISSFYEWGNWLLRLDVFGNGAQHRYALDYGNVIGKDLGATKGFVTLNVYGGYKYKFFMILAGIDNLTNALYAYHLSKNGIDIPALNIAPTQRIYEPGRNMWIKMRVNF